MKNKKKAKKSKQDFWAPRDPNDLPLKHGSHEQLWQIAIKLPTDVEPWGLREPGAIGDCSCGCRWFQPLVAYPFDWGVCTNPASPRVALLTFEHQGCPQFEVEEDPGSEHGSGD
jgi:hypothetical protein